MYKYDRATMQVQLLFTQHVQSRCAFGTSSFEKSQSSSLAYFINANIFQFQYNVTQQQPKLVTSTPLLPPFDAGVYFCSMERNLAVNGTRIIDFVTGAIVLQRPTGTTLFKLFVDADNVLYFCEEDAQSHFAIYQYNMQRRLLRTIFRAQGADLIHRVVAWQNKIVFFTVNDATIETLDLQTSEHAVLIHGSYLKAMHLYGNELYWYDKDTVYVCELPACTSFSTRTFLITCAASRKALFKVSGIVKDIFVTTEHVLYSVELE